MADLELLSSGFAAELLPTRDGLPVLCTDIERILRAQFQSPSRVHCLFAMFDFTTQKAWRGGHPGIVFVKVVCKPVFSESQRPFHRKILTVFHLHAMHLINVAPPSIRPAVNGVYVPLVSKLMDGIQMTTRHVHNCVSGEDATIALREFGLSKAGLPPIVGGTWKYRYFDAWLSHRQGGGARHRACDRRRKWKRRLDDKPALTATAKRVRVTLSSREHDAART